MEVGYVLLRDTTVVVDGEVERGKWIQLGFVTESIQTGCRRCSIRLQSQNGSLMLCWDDVDAFMGMEADVVCCTTRSDASLLLGTLKACRPHVTASISVFFYENDLQNQNCSMVMTVSFPNLLQGVPGKRSILQGRNTKILSPQMQLLLSMLSSDWEKLDSFMDHLKRNPLRATERRQTSFFTTKVSFEQLYLRIPGSTADDPVRRGSSAQKTDSWLLQLPRELVVERIAPFLRAKSLHSLRRTCRTFHEALRATVPGLRRLRLYSHQIDSLSWMREREARSLCENDCLVGSGDDLHRAATGGLTTLLRTRCNQASVRVVQTTGMEFQPYIIPRKVARGGLLCDDPGLGKTITVLSLVLQTLGLCPELAVSGEQPKSSPDIFQVYWTENVPDDIRKQLLLKLVNDLARRDRGPYPLFDVARIRKAIYHNGSGSDFSKFEDEVR
jgi:hypothetical protein